ncbi:MAG: phenylacetate-CoA ligase [Planctomycetota bacterium]|jgi:phenylacetate-CoA ligase
MRDIVWSATLKSNASLLRSISKQLEESQWWSPEKLEQYQFLRLQKLLDHAYKTVPFYRQRLDKSGWAPGEAITRNSFRQLPILKRSDVNRAGNKLYANVVPGKHGRIREISTSGSTGNPVTILNTGLSKLVWDVITLRDHQWHKRDFSKSIAFIRHLTVNKSIAPEGTSYNSWGGPVAKVYATGPGYSLNIRSTATEQLDWLQKINPHYLVTFPSAAEAMAELSLKRNRQISNLCEVLTLGESLSASIINTVNKAWGVPVTDCYSSKEAGYIALQAPDNDYYLVQSEVVIVEILNDHNEPCKPGEIGRVVVTPLYNFAAPLIRYELDDFAEIGAPSDCGRGLPVLKKILGRSRNMLVLPNGEKRFPAIGIKSFNRENGEKIRKYQVIQETLDRMIIKLVMDPPYSEEEESCLRKHIQTRVNHPFDIKFIYLDDIPRGAGGKYEDFRSDVQNP